VDPATILPFQRALQHLDSFDVASNQARANDAARDGDAAQEAACLVRLATGLQYANRHEEALSEFKGVLSRSTEPGVAPYVHFAEQHMGKCLVEMGRFSEARAAFDRAMARREAMGNEALIASTRRALSGLQKRAARAPDLMRPS